MEIRLPFLAEESPEATVSYWLVDEGDHVEKDDDLVEMTTSKAVFNVPSPAAGTIAEIVAKEGQVVKVGEVLAILEED